MRDATCSTLVGLSVGAGVRVERVESLNGQCTTLPPGGVSEGEDTELARAFADGPSALNLE